MPVAVVERSVVLDVKRQGYLQEAGRIDVMYGGLTVSTIDELEVVTAVSALLRVFHPSVFAVIVWINARNSTVHISR